jgi:chromosome segregation ATPase
MVETPETKAKLEAILEKARRLHPLRQAREKLALELGNLPYNLIPLQMAGKTLAGEKQRIGNEIAKLSQQEDSLHSELREFLGSLIQPAVQVVQGQITDAFQKRQRLRALLAEAAAVYAEIKQVEATWKSELAALRKVASELSQQTGESYSMPDVSFPSPWLPSPPVQQVERARTHGDNIVTILEEMARQIG